jgi:hypothetical protein
MSEVSRIDPTAVRSAVILRKGAESSVASSLSDTSTDDDDVHTGGDAGLISRFLSIAEADAAGPAVKLMQRLLRMLRTCKYAEDDIVSVLGLAAAHHRTFQISLPAKATQTERAFILIAQIYIAHCVVLDEYCCLGNWHRYLFASYCDLHALNSAVARILRRMDWRLHGVTDNEISTLVNFIKH